MITAWLHKRMCLEFLYACITRAEVFFIRDTPEPWQLKAPGPKPTIEQLEEACKGNGRPRKGDRWPRKGNGPPITGTKGPSNCRKRL